MFFLTYANMDNVSSQVSGSSSVLAADWNTFVRDNFDDLKAGHVVLVTADRLALGVPATGTVVFDSTLGILMLFNGSAWVVSPGSSLTSTQKIAIPAPATGSFIYDSTLGVFQFYNGSAWVVPPQVGAVGVIATKNAPQSISGGVGTVVTFPGSDEADSNSFHNPASNNSRITIPTGLGGVYLFDVRVSFTSGGGTPGSSFIRLLQNGNPYLGNLVQNTGFVAGHSYSGSNICVASAGDYFEVEIYTTGSSQVQSTAADYRPTLFSAYRLGA